jgi:hypothetical protein
LPSLFAGKPRFQAGRRAANCGKIGTIGDFRGCSLSISPQPAVASGRCLVRFSTFK